MSTIKSLASSQAPKERQATTLTEPSGGQWAAPTAARSEGLTEAGVRCAGEQKVSGTGGKAEPRASAKKWSGGDWEGGEKRDEEAGAVEGDGENDGCLVKYGLVIVSLEKP